MTLERAVQTGVPEQYREDSDILLLYGYPELNTVYHVEPVQVVSPCIMQTSVVSYLHVFVTTRVAASNTRGCSLPVITVFRSLCCAGGIMFSHDVRRGCCPVFPPVFCPVRHRFLSLRKNTEPMSMKFAGGYHYHKQIKRLYLGEIKNGNKGTGYERKFESIDVSRFCRDVKQVLTPSEWIYKRHRRR